MIGDDNMFVCIECGEIFEEPIYWEERHGLSSPPYERFSGCPSCRSGYTEAFKCDCCDEWIDELYIETEDDKRYCLNCYQVRHVGDE